MEEDDLWAEVLAFSGVREPNRPRRPGVGLDDHYWPNCVGVGEEHRVGGQDPHIAEAGAGTSGLCDGRGHTSQAALEPQGGFGVRVRGRVLGATG